MSKIQNLKSWIDDNIILNPQLRSEINSLYILCLDEIDSGESESHEIELCEQSVNQLIEAEKLNEV